METHPQAIYWSDPDTMRRTDTAVDHIRRAVDYHQRVNHADGHERDWLIRQRNSEARSAQQHRNKALASANLHDETLIYQVTAPAEFGAMWFRWA